MTKFTRTNIGPLSSGLTSIALGNAGVVASVPLLLIIGFFQTKSSLVLSLFGLELIVSLLMILVGVICCFFSPLRLTTKAKLLMTGLALFMWARFDHVAAGLSLIVAFFCGLSFAYALCDEFEASDVKTRLNRMVLMVVSAPLVAILGVLTEKLSNFLGWTFLTLSLVMLLMALVGTIAALLSLVLRVRQLRLELPEQEENHTGISRL